MIPTVWKLSILYARWDLSMIGMESWSYRPEEMESYERWYPRHEEQTYCTWRTILPLMALKAGVFFITHCDASLYGLISPLMYTTQSWLLVSCSSKYDTPSPKAATCVSRGWTAPISGKLEFSGMDILGTLQKKKSGNQLVMALTDLYTKLTRAI